MATTRSKAERFDKSYRALRIYWPTRWRLQLAARTDRRAGLPIGLSSDTTPVLRDLVARRDDACEHERTRYPTAVQPLNVRLAQLDADVASLERMLEERTAEAVRATAAPTERQLALRHAGEQDLPAALVRQRRETDHRRLAEAATAAQADAQQRLDATRGEHAQLEAKRQSRADVARSRVLRYVHYADRLAAIYRRALVRRHPQREALVQAWSTDLYPPPAWVLADELVPSHRTTGAAA
ncbi:MAG: hypothetical protein JWO98_1044 [Frankiales bacterium]|nr:hypothetical protein [Frankiales bacterium]